MNKFAIVALFACVAAASASSIPLDGDELESSASFNPSNGEETALLTDQTRIFSDFCINSRDLVVGDIRSTSNTFASRVFSVLFNSAEEIGLNAVNVQRDAANKLSEQIRNPSTKISEGTNEVENIIADGQRTIQTDSSQPKSLFTGIISVLAATKNVVTANVLAKFDEFKSLFGLTMITEGLKEACTRVSEYERQIQELFQRTKSSMASESPAAASLHLEDIQCVTARRIIRLDGLCKFAMAAKNPFMKVITYKPIPDSE